ncbi:MAG: nitroreductase family protein [Actinomycetota bacterium]
MPPDRPDASEPSDSPYEFPYPNPVLAADHPFVALEFEHRSLDEMRAAGRSFHEHLARRRSVRMLAPDPIPLDVIDQAIATASTAPSGAHLQPWTWVVVGDPDLKRQIREAAEEEERRNYLDNRMNAEWQQALAPLGTDHHKEFLEVAPWIVVLFEQRYGINDDGSKKHHYYVKESCGIAAGLFIAALHEAGLATLTHTPSPMAFLTRILGRPDHERPFVLFPVGRPLPGVRVPDIERKPLDDVRVIVGDVQSHLR